MQGDCRDMQRLENSTTPQPCCPSLRVCLTSKGLEAREWWAGSKVLLQSGELHLTQQKLHMFSYVPSQILTAMWICHAFRLKLVHQTRHQMLLKIKQGGSSAEGSPIDSPDNANSWRMNEEKKKKKHTCGVPCLQTSRCTGGIGRPSTTCAIIFVEADRKSKQSRSKALRIPGIPKFKNV